MIDGLKCPFVFFEKPGSKLKYRLPGLVVAIRCITAKPRSAVLNSGNPNSSSLQPPVLLESAKDSLAENTVAFLRRVNAVEAAPAAHGPCTLVFVRMRPPPFYKFQVKGTIGQTFGGAIVSPTDGEEVEWLDGKIKLVRRRSPARLRAPSGASACACDSTPHPTDRVRPKR